MGQQLLSISTSIYFRHIMSDRYSQSIVRHQYDEQASVAERVMRAMVCLRLARTLDAVVAWPRRHGRLGPEAF
jgi:hypothetical protein